MVQKEPCTSRGFGSRKLVKVMSIAKEKPGAESSPYMGDAHMHMHTSMCTSRTHASMLRIGTHACMHTNCVGSNGISHASTRTKYV